MISVKSRMRVSTAVRDYIGMFPDEYRDVLRSIKIQRKNLKTDLAELEGTHGIQRALYTIPEKVHDMIVMKLDSDELARFKDKDTARWFVSEFPQFAVTRRV